MKLLLLILLPFLGFSQENKSKENQPTIFVFVAETCPICQYYTKKLREISATYPYEIVLVFPNKLSTEETVEKYKKKYKLEFRHIIDGDHFWVKKLNAEVTPEVFVYNSDQDSIYYKGRIDDNYFRVGQRKASVQSDDLVNALENIKNKKKIEIAETKAVGCFITKKVNQ